MSEIQQFYHIECNESKRLSFQSGQIEYLTTMKYLKMYCKKNMSVLDACAGGGIYSFPLAELGCHVTAGDLIDVNVEHIISENCKKQILKQIYQGNVLNLSSFEDQSFDIVLNLGSYYHLCNEADRHKSLSETLRVLKDGGIYIIAYINRYANYLAHFEEFKDNFSFLVNYMNKGSIENSSLFYSTTPEMIEEDLIKQNLKLLHHIATDGPIFIYREIVDEMSKDDFGKFMNIHLSLCDKRSNLGYSEHGLIIGQKQKIKI